MHRGQRLLLRDVDIWKYPPALNPVRIRLSVRTQAGGIEPGDRISVKAVLSPPPRPVFPGGYDFARYAFFQKIGAVGYAISPVRIKAKNTNGESLISRVRHIATRRIHNGIASEESAYVAAAMLTGKRAGLGMQTMSHIRDAGIAHLLSISGLHLAIVCTTVFACVRSFFALIPAIALRHNTKKWGAVVALLAGFAYLLIAGSPVPAQRSYIMAALFFLCILWDRISIPMRPIAWAALAVLILAPESVMGPSFQMSFAAVIALVAFYEIIKRQTWLPERRSLSARFLWYVAGVVGSSLVAGMATAPYSIAHFGTYALYGILGNLFAVPLSGIVIMPAGAAALALMPIGLEQAPLWVMGKAIDIMLRYAKWVSSLPHAAVSLPTLDSAALLLITLGGLWLCLWQRAVRLLGVLPVCAGIVAAFLRAEPDIIVDERGKLFAVRAADGTLLFSTRIPARYARNQWQVHDGQKHAPKLSEAPAESSHATCTAETCAYINRGIRAVFLLPDAILGAEAMQQLCRDADIFIAMNSDDASCSTAKYVITSRALRRRGTHALWLGGDIIVRTVEGERGQRPWTQSHTQANME